MTTIYLLGDSHSSWPREWPDADLVISVGDFGFWPDYKGQWLKRRPPYPVWFIDGNHEHFPHLLRARGGSLTEGGVVEVWPGAFHVPRGHVEKLNGLTVGFCGGGDSIDKDYRVEGVDWFPEEEVREVEFPELDVLVTHTATNGVLAALFGPIVNQRNPLNGKPLVQRSALAVSGMAWRSKAKRHYCGDLHRSYSDGLTRVLNVNEFLLFMEER